MIKLVSQSKNGLQKLGNKIFPVALLFSLILLLAVYISFAPIAHIWFSQPGAVSALSAKPISTKVSDITTSTNKPQFTPEEKNVAEVPACNPVHIPLLNPIIPSGISNGIHKTTLKQHYYNVSGNSTTEIIDQIYQCGPLIDGKRYGAVTNYEISWKFGYAPKPDDQNLCIINNIVVTQATQISLPSWHANEDVTALLNSRWQNLYSTLLDHENGHVKMTSDTSRNIYNKLETMPYSSCSDIGKKANGLAYGELSKLKSDNAKYDATTNHGTN